MSFSRSGTATPSYASAPTPPREAWDTWTPRRTSSLPTARTSVPGPALVSPTALRGRHDPFMGSPVDERSAFLDAPGGRSPPSTPAVRRTTIEQRKQRMEKFFVSILLREDIWRFHGELGTFLFLPNRPADAFSRMRWALMGTPQPEPVAWYSETENWFAVGPLHWVHDLMIRHGAALVLRGAEPVSLCERLLHNSAGAPHSFPGLFARPPWAPSVPEPIPVDLNEWLVAEVTDNERRP